MDKGHNFKTLKNGNDFDFKITFGQGKGLENMEK